jgi:hypothetical protein
MELFREFLHSWYQQLTTVQKGRMGFTRSDSVALGYKYRIGDLNQALSKWAEWVRTQKQRRQQQQQQQRPEGLGLVTADRLARHDRWSECVSDLRLRSYSEACVIQPHNRSVRVVPAQHRGAAEFSWVLVHPVLADASYMTFFKVDRIVKHTNGDGVVAELLFGDLHSSRCASGGVALHPFIGMPVFSSTPDPNHSGVLPAGFKVCVSCSNARLSGMSVLPLPDDPDKLVCLTRQPTTLFTAAGLPTPD